MHAGEGKNKKENPDISSYAVMQMLVELRNNTDVENVSEEHKRVDGKFIPKRSNSNGAAFKLGTP